MDVDIVIRREDAGLLYGVVEASANRFFYQTGSCQRVQRRRKAAGYSVGVGTDR